MTDLLKTPTKKTGRGMHVQSQKHSSASLLRPNSRTTNSLFNRPAMIKLEFKINYARCVVQNTFKLKCKHQ